MSEQSDTPRTTRLLMSLPAEIVARQLERELTAATRERDEARAEVERLRALTICGCGDHFAIGFEGTCPNCIAAGKEPKP